MYLNGYLFKKSFIPLRFPSHSQRATELFLKSIHTGRMEKLQRQGAPKDSLKVAGETPVYRRFIGFLEGTGLPERVCCGHHPSRSTGAWN
jgi:hypothetical protein